MPGRALAAQPLRAQRRDRLDDGQVVAAREQREEAARDGRARSAAAPARGALAGELRGHRVGGQVVDRRGVAVPGRLAREPGEVGEQLGVDPPVGPIERRQRQLVEHDVHDRRASTAPGPRRSRRRRAGTAGRARGRRRGTARGRRAARATSTVSERAHAVGARVQGGGARAQRQRDGHGEPPSRRAGRPPAAARARRRAARRTRASRAQPSAGRSLPEAPHERGAGRAAAPACSRTRAARMSPAVLPRATKNSALSPEQLEERLGEGERPQPAEMQRGAREADGRSRPRACLVERAASRTPALVRSTSKRSASARSKTACVVVGVARRRACRSSRRCTIGSARSGNSITSAVSSDRSQSRNSRTGTLPVMQTWWTTARQSARSGVPRRSSDARSRPRQPRSGDGSVTLITSGRTSVAALVAQRSVQGVDGRVVGVEGDHEVGVLGRDRASSGRRCSRRPTRAAERRRAAASRTNSAFAPADCVVVGVVLAVARPGRLARLPLEPPDELLQLAEVRRQQLLVEAGALHLAA